MELSFVVNAVRRYWWLFIACLVLGGVPGLLLTDESAASYESLGTVLVSPPSESLFQVSFTNDPDRYVVSQLSILRSEALAERVATRVSDEMGRDISTAEVGTALTVRHSSKTDIVDLVVASPEPELSRLIVDAYIDLYFTSLRDQVNDSQEPEIQQLDEQLTDLQDQLTLIDESIAATMLPFLQREADPSGAFAPIPTLEQVAPQLASARTLVTSEINQVLSSKNELELSGKLRVTSQVVQRATLPTEPIIESGRLLLAAGLAAGGLLGLIACVVVARLSRTALDENQVGELLGAPVVGELPHARLLSKNRRAAVENLPDRVIPFVDALCVRAEANAKVGEALTVVVVGLERGSGTTTLAGAMANRYAANGSQVVLIDADPRDPELSRLFSAGSSGIPGLLAAATLDSGLPRRNREGVRVDPYSPTAMRGLRVVGIGDKGTASGLRRQNVPEVIDISRRTAHVVVFDAGPLMDAASSVQLTQLVDAVVLAVPTRRLYTRTLQVVATRLRSRRGELLPVWVPASRRRGGRAVEAGQVATAPIGLAGEPDIETAVDARRSTADSATDPSTQRA